MYQLFKTIMIVSFLLENQTEWHSRWPMKQPERPIYCLSITLQYIIKPKHHFERQFQTPKKMNTSSYVLQCSNWCSGTLLVWLNNNMIHEYCNWIHSEWKLYMSCSNWSSCTGNKYVLMLSFDQIRIWAILIYKSWLLQ